MSMRKIFCILDSNSAKSKTVTASHDATSSLGTLAGVIKTSIIACDDGSMRYRVELREHGGKSMDMARGKVIRVLCEGVIPR